MTEFKGHGNFQQDMPFCWKRKATTPQAIIFLERSVMNMGYSVCVVVVVVVVVVYVWGGGGGYEKQFHFV